MLNLKYKRLILALLIKSLLVLPLSILAVVPSQAHLDKSYDLNGGHYDNFGNYHCHLQGCRMTESRYQYRRNRLAGRASDRSEYFNQEDWPYWEDMDNDCQDARTEVLVLTSQVQVTYTNPRNCEVREGLWVDQYTGEQYTRAGELEIDHIIPPEYADASNGYQWDYSKRYNFANDPLNLIPVSRATHRRKRERGIASYRPRDEYLCEYATAWQMVSEIYDLDLFTRDRSRMRSILEDCKITEEGIIEEQ